MHRVWGRQHVEVAVGRVAGGGEQRWTLREARIWRLGCRTGNHTGMLRSWRGVTGLLSLGGRILGRVAVFALLTVGARLACLRIDAGLVVPGHIDDLGSDMMARSRKAMAGQPWGGRRGAVAVRGRFVQVVTMAERDRHACWSCLESCASVRYPRARPATLGQNLCTLQSRRSGCAVWVGWHLHRDYVYLRDLPCWHVVVDAASRLGPLAF